MINKRLFILIAAFMVNCAVFSQSPIAEGKSKFLGNVYSSTQKVDFEEYWNQVTPENAGKWGHVEAQRDVMTWNELDAAYNLAKDNNSIFKLHVLVWGNQQPSWMNSLSADEQLEEIEEWFSEVANRYPDIDFIEVVNEPLHAAPAYKNALGGNGSSGHDWVIKSFQLARQYFPDVKLMINEYNIINNGGKTNQYKAIINSLKSSDLIDAIGIQGHAFSTTASNFAMLTNLGTLSELDLPIYITELDIDGPTDDKQLFEYKRIFNLLWKHPSVKGITLWGWRPGLWRHDEKAYIINLDNTTERPALLWLRDFVSSTVLSNKNVLQDQTLEIWPNPTTDIVRIKSDTKYSTYNIYNTTGHLLKSAKLNSTEIDLSSFGSNQNLILELIDKTQHSVFSKVFKL